MRPKSTNRDLPPRLIRVRRVLRTGKVWEAFYYNGRDADGKRIKIPLGQDLHIAKAKWAELERDERPVQAATLGHIFNRFEREVLPSKAPRTQKDYTEAIAMLRRVFDDAPIDAVQPMHIRAYLDRRSAKTRANREIALFSSIWNRAREWGYTDRQNPTSGVTKHREKPREFYADEAVWDAVYGAADDVVRDAMDLAYLTGQRPADVLAMRWADVRDGALEVRQGKTAKRLRILVEGKLAALIDRLRDKPVSGLHLVTLENGQRLGRWALRARFDKARELAATGAEGELAERIRQFQFRDIRPKAASETDLAHASKLLGHTDKQITQTVYRRVGEVVKPTR
jgi:integrase